MRGHQAMDLGFDRPHPARVYSYWIGGKDHFQVDRDAGDELAVALPSLPIAARANRGFMVRVVRHLSAAQGIRQFLDIGCGLPIQPNLHEIVQGIVPASRVVCVDNDPLVLVHARALLTSTPQGTVDYVDADLHDPPRAVAAQAVAQNHGLSVTLRSKAQAEAMLAGLDLIDPGVTLVHHWRPDPTEPQPAERDVHVWGGVALKR